MARNILIIENDGDLVLILKELFGYEGYNVSIHQEVADIFPLIDNFKPDIVLLDYLLPGINGGEICAQIKKSPETNEIPVVIFSAYPQVMLSLGSYGCNAFIPKPFDLSMLLDQINDCIENPGKVFELTSSIP